MTDAEVLEYLATGARIVYDSDSPNGEVITWHGDIGTLQIQRLSDEGWLTGFANGSGYRMSEEGRDRFHQEFGSVQRVFHFCIEYNQAGSTHICEGIFTTRTDVFDPGFHSFIREQLCARMDPPRPPEQVVIRSLTLLGEKK